MHVCLSVNEFLFFPQVIVAARTFRSATDLHTDMPFTDTDELYQNLIASGVTFRSIAAYVVVAVVQSKREPFKTPISGHDNSISTKDPRMGYTFWWLVVHWLIAGVEKNLFKVPGLSTAPISAGSNMTECDKMRAAGTTMMAKFTVIMADDTPNLFKFFFQPNPAIAAAAQAMEASDDDGAAVSDNEELTQRPGGGDDSNSDNENEEEDE